MEKTKLGLSIPLFAAIAVLLAMFGGYTAAVLVVGYVLIFEADSSLKRTVVTALVVMLACSILNFLIGLIPGLVGLVQSFLSIFKIYFSMEFFYNVEAFFSNIISLGKSVILALLAVTAFIGKPVELPIVKKYID